MANVFNCPACGEMISADVSAGQQVQCPLCSKVVAVPEDAGPLAAETVSYSSAPGGAFGGSMSQGMAIAALVCGILGLGCLPVGIVGIVLGIVALVRISREPRRYRGTGMAIGGICTGAGRGNDPAVEDKHTAVEAAASSTVGPAGAGD